MATKAVNGVANGAVSAAEKSDLAQMWAKAVEEYEKKTKRSLKLAPGTTMAEVMASTEQQTNNFNAFRHSGSNTDKVRTAFKNNMGIIQKVVSGVEILGAAASAFPPAMPAGLIFAAFSQVTQSFNTVSADYDKVIGFFEFTRRFMDRLSMIEQKSPKLAPFQRCVVRVFSNMLTICAVAQDFAKEKRFKKWFMTLMDGSDPQLKGAYEEMEAAINELSQAVGLATLRTVEIVRGIMESMDQKVDILVEKVTQFDEGMNILDTNTNIIIKQTQESNTQLSQIQESLRKLTRVSRETHDRVLEKDSAPHPGQKKAKTDPGENKRIALDSIKKFFSDFSPTWTNVTRETKGQRREIQETSVKDTGSWFVNDEGSFKAWISEETPILWLRGSAGIGKSFLAQRAITEVESVFKDRSPSAYFFFREEEESLRSFANALYCLAFQMAEMDPKYAERLSMEFSNFRQNQDSGPWVSPPWKALFADIFVAKSDDHAYLVLDGIDEMRDTDRKEMLECFGQITKENLNIHVLLTGRPNVSSELEGLISSTFDVTKENLATDINKVIISNLTTKTFPRLRKFRKQVKNVIWRKIRSKADGMRYVDHMLRRLSYIGREKGVLNDLDKNLPNNLEELYSLMLAECQANRTDAQYQTLKKLFAWLAYSKRALSLAEAAELITLTVDDTKTFDIEDEIIGRSARILELAKGPEEEDVGGEDENSDINESSENGEVDLQDSGNAPLSFQERSLREYFQAVDVDEKGLRTPPSAAHFTIFEMATDLLFQATEESDDQKLPKVLSYASEFWVKHLVEIDLAKANDEEAARVANILHKIMTNHKNIAQLFEHYNGILYSELLSESGAPWLDVVKNWVVRATSSTSITLTPDVETWAKEFTASETPLMTLARGHVINWFTKGPNGIPIYQAFRFARDAFCLSKIDVVADSLESVLKVADHFPDIEKDAMALRAISASVSEMELADDAIVYVNKAFDMLLEEPNHHPALPFYLTRGLSINHASLGHHDETVQEIDKALGLLPADWRESTELVESVQWIYEEKAAALKTLGKEDEAVQAYVDIRTVRPDKTLDSWLITQMVYILFSSSDDSNGDKVMSLLQALSEKELISWFDSIVASNDSYAMEMLNQKVALNGNEAKEFLLQSYSNYMATLPASGDKLACARAALAATYRIVIGDHSKAKELYTEILKHNLQDLELRFMFDRILFEVRRSLAEIIFQEFHTSTDPAKKVTLLEEIQGISSELGDNSNFSLEGSNVSVMVALMSRVVGQIIEYQSMLQKTFDHCIEGLSDSVGWNDSTSFRLLAKVLASVEGLERDAVIALSCQFSKVTDDPEETPTEAAEKASDAMDTGDAEGSADVAANEPDERTVETVINAPKEPIHIIETTISTFDVEDGVEKNKETIVIEEASVEASHDSDNTSNKAEKPGESEAVVPDPYADEEKIAANPDEEIGFGGLSCDGECHRSWDSWEVPVYFCLICANSDLCPTCYGKRIAQNHGEKNTFWRSYCGKDHRYAKGPIKGWRGVKGGSWRIEQIDGVVEEKQVQEWLKELKNDRWPKAWEEFWKRLEGVKDIGF